MPASNMSRLSLANGAPRCDLAANLARDIAQRKIGIKIKNGELSAKEDIEKEYKAIYYIEYYKHYTFLVQHDQQSRIQYVITENPSAKKFYIRHAIAGFSQTNCFIRVQRGTITVSRINYPFDQEDFIDCKEDFLLEWPGPLDRPDSQLKGRITDYIDTLIQHDSQRRLRYPENNDKQRKTILCLLTELLHRSGSIDAPAFTRLLLPPEKIQITKDEDKLVTLQKYLLLGKRGDAVKFAKSIKLWDHAQCIAFLSKYQPPITSNYYSDGYSGGLKKDSIVELNVEYISGVADRTLATVYRSMLNRILNSDPESKNIVKSHNVDNDPYEFAILSANDCDIEFDQTNELFKLIVEVKRILNPGAAYSSHLIDLGYTSLDFEFEMPEDSSLRSQRSHLKADTLHSRTLTISNIDMLILNEIWEYCQNLVKGTCNPRDYEYIIDLVPFKLIFASKLLDLGLHQMFACYLSSIKNALAKSQDVSKDPIYDWGTIEQSVKHLEEIWKLFEYSYGALPQKSTSPESLIQRQNQMYDTGLYNPSPPVYNQQFHSMHDQMAQNEFNPDMIDSGQNDYTSLPYQSETAYPSLNQTFPHSRQYIPPPIFNQKPIQEETTDFNPEPSPSAQLDDNTKNMYEPQQNPNFINYSNDSSRRASASASQSMDMPLFSPPTFGQPGTTLSEQRSGQKLMTSSSPVHSNNRDSMQSNPPQGDPFNTPFSPINEYDDLPRQDPAARATSGASTSTGLGDSHQNASGSGAQSNSNNSKPQSAGDQQSGIFSGLLGTAAKLLPKSNSKQMILPDDSQKRMIYDDSKNRWVDTSKPEGEQDEEIDDAPPIMAIAKPPTTYTIGSKKRYPPPAFK